MRTIQAVFLLSLLCPAGCGTKGGTEPIDMAADAATDKAVVDDLPGVDGTVVPDVRAETVPEVVFEFATEETFLECAPGEGCFMDHCSKNADCQSGWCVQHMGEGMCSKSCKEECPAGWTCKQLADTDPDVVYICVSDYSNLCRPCSSGNDCKTTTGVEDVCVNYGADGKFCGGACTVNDECPWGFTCQEAETVDGVILSQCVADAGVCPCTGTSVELGLFTPCSVSNEWGVCEGKRVCAEEGLLDCDAFTPAKEACNGLDDNCDGDVDEALFFEGKYLDLCDDGNGCTADSCKGEEGCQYETLTEGECMDGDACTVGDHCEEGECIGTPVPCDDDNPCTDDSCDGLGGCKFENNTEDCDDSDPCTVADQCEEAVCVGFGIPCDCQTDADCVQFDDGDKCTGSLFCDTKTLPYKCTVDPDTVVECPEPVGLDAICRKAWCDPDTGECSIVPDHEGFACDDGDLCTIGDKCADTLCQPGVSAVCDDGNICTDDSCVPETGCSHQNNSLECNDGDVCTTGDQCVDGVCGGGPEMVCDDGNVCTDDSCDQDLGCVHTPKPAFCDDGNACTTGDYCQEGKCIPAGDVDCDDGNPCTKDSCLADQGCTYENLAIGCSDGDPCTVNDQCNGGICVSGPVVDCDDGNVCTDDSCNDDGLCENLPVDGGCDDGNACTDGDHCDGGSCVYELLENCDDDNVCTTDSCHPAQGCLHTLNDAPCTDDDVCTTGDHCHLGQCISSGSLVCVDANDCTDDECSPQAGCVFLPNNAPCDDADVCTVDDACGGGECVPGESLPCDDGNDCTDDSCDPAAGCVYMANNAVCDDGDACTTGEFCSDSACGGGALMVCDDANPCTDDSCGQAVGCIFENNTVGCDDGDACTIDDVCAGGQCVSGGALDCDDGNVCTTDDCDSQAGCLHPPVANETPCGADKHCIDGLCEDICQMAHGQQVFAYTGSVQAFVVPDCVDSVTIETWGAQGGHYGSSSFGGKGGYAKGDLTGAAGKTLHVYVGGKGGYSGEKAIAGWNGGGGHSGPENHTVGGGGASDVRMGGQGLNNRVIVAGGGGASAWCYNSSAVGGHGGGLDGVHGGHSNNSGNGYGRKGTQSSGGIGGTFDWGSGGNGSLGQGGAGKNTNGGCGGAGGGGGGYYGGGGGAHGGGGGGGSSYISGLDNASTQTGIRNGNGEIKFTW